MYCIYNKKTKNYYSRRDVFGDFSVAAKSWSEYELREIMYVKISTYKITDELLPMFVNCVIVWRYSKTV